MSGGGSGPSAPNLSSNIGAANAISGTATGDAAQTMATANSYNANAQNTLNSVNAAQAPITAQTQAQASQNMNTYGNTFVPLQAQQAQQAQNYTSDQNVQQLQGMAAADANSSQQASLANQRASLASEGVDPASVQGAALSQQAAVAGGANVANAENQSYLNTQNTGRQLVAGANQLGMQVGAAGTSGAQAGSQMGSAAVGNTNSTNASGINNMTASNTYLNTGVSANNSAMTGAQDQFQDQNTVYQNQVAAQNSTMSDIGSIAGAAMMMSKGGPVPNGTPGGYHTAALPMPAPQHGQAPHYFHPNIRRHQLSTLMPMVGGGPVSGRGALPTPPDPSNPTDTKPALLTPGEFVIPHDAAAHMGHEFWYKQIDKARQGIAQRHGIAPPPTSAWSAKGH